MSRTSVTPLLTSGGRTVKATVLVLAATLLIPFLVHLIPAPGPVPVGARLLPMFYAPFVAVVLFRYPVGLVAGVAAPVINHLLTGRPALPLMSILCVELAASVLVAAALLRVPYLRWVAAPLSYLGAKAVSVALLAARPGWMPGTQPLDFALSSIANAWPGLVILLVINVVALRGRKMGHSRQSSY
jgi:hypothetical protein